MRWILASTAAVGVVVGLITVGQPASATNFVLAKIRIVSETRPDPAPVDVAVDPRSHQAYVANTFEGTVSVIDTVSREVTATIPHGATSIGDGPSSVAIDEAGRKAYVVNYNSDTVSVIDIPTNRVLKVLPHDSTRGIGAHPSAIEIDTTLRRAYVTNLVDGTVSVIDTVSDTVIDVIAHDPVAGIGTFLIGIAIDQELHRAYVTNNSDDTVSVIDTRRNNVIAVIPHDAGRGIGDAPREIAVDTGTHRAFVTNSGDNTISVIDTRSNSVVAVLPHDESAGIPSGAWWVTADSVGGQVLVASKDRIVAIDTSSLKITRTIERSTSADFGYGAGGMVVDPGRRELLVTASVTNTVAVIDIDTTAALSRLSGVDRFDGSAAVSRREFASGGDVVYVASGATFPDALSGSAAAAAKKAPVLLVARDTVPTAVGAELARLRPKRIVVLGGTASVGDAVERALRSYAPVTRLGGADRYEVSARISQDAFPAATPVAYVASGEVFPDALAGGAASAAGGGGASLLLVTRDSVPAVVAAELRRLAPGKIVVLGGESTVSARVATELGAIAPTSRIAGPDRYAGSAAVSRAAYPSGAPAVFVASGAVFPDALAGGSAAAANGAPILLVAPDSVPTSVADEITRLGARRIVVLGGTNTVSPAVLTRLRALLGQAG
ncbi:hypothetical protein GCM10009851_20260 [Herbiconiux moechotypicola]|uniref:Uncharacterized protein n=1 Tax=Herbiconiux moechotypicola TaxID=637393 RepID=A0ABN3DKX7_9MICO